jgi:cobalt/nickel transport system permease protein
MHLEVFAEGDSFLHRMDPRVKIIVFLSFSLLCATSNTLKITFLYLLYSASLIFCSKIRLKAFLTRLLGANFFIGLIWLFVPMRYFQLEQALMVTMKSNAIIMATIALLATSSVFSLARASLDLKFPKKLASILFLLYRYLTVNHEEYEKLKRAISARGFSPRLNVHTYKTYGYLIGGLLVRSYERAEETYKCMLSRGFKGDFPLYDVLTWQKRDLVFGIIMILITSFIRFKS